MEQVKQLIDNLKKAYDEGKSRKYEFRINQLSAIKRLIEENEEMLSDALYKDLHKSKYETYSTSFTIIKNEIACITQNLKRWMQSEHVQKDWIQSMNSAYVKYEPYGLIFIIGPWNFPLQLCLIPLIGVIAAGNVAILKPSPISVATTKALCKLIPQYLDNECYAVLEADGDLTAKILDNFRFDHIVFTGGTAIAKSIMKAASKNLTPLTLELGGKCPAILFEDLDLRTAVRRIMWGKFSNCGQTCIAPDYVITTSPKMTSAFLRMSKEILIEFYGLDPFTSDSYGRIINKHHFERILALLKDCKIDHGGKNDENSLYIEPTIVADVKGDDLLMQDEIFGPILPIMEIDCVDKIIQYLNSREKALAIYLFTFDQHIQNRFENETSSGAFSINDVIMHYTYENLPFGGVGYSGMGHYHGKYSFQQFSHLKACLNSSIWSERINELRYPPHTEKKSKWLAWILGK